MSRSILVPFALVLFAGCANRTFTDLGGGVGVPSESIAEYAEAHGLSHDDARAIMRQDMGQSSDFIYAEDYDISIDDAHEPVKNAESLTPR